MTQVTPSPSPAPTADAPPALTSTFAPALSCFTDYYSYPFRTSQAIIQLGPTTTSGCFPSGWVADASQYFSPGVCPSGYSIACLNTSPGIEETQATCCPTGYSCQLSLSQLGTKYPWFSTFHCTRTLGDFSGSAITLTSTDSAGTVQKIATVINFGGVNAYGIKIRSRSADFEITSMVKSTMSSSTAESETSSSAATVTQSSAATQSATPLRAGLTNKAKAGIGAVVGILLLIVIAAAIFLFMRARARKRTPGLPSPPPPPWTYNREYKAELDSSSAAQSPQVFAPKSPPQIYTPIPSSEIFATELPSQPYLPPPPIYVSELPGRVQGVSHTTIYGEMEVARASYTGGQPELSSREASAQELSEPYTTSRRYETTAVP